MDSLLAGSEVPLNYGVVADGLQWRSLPIFIAESCYVATRKRGLLSKRPICKIRGSLFGHFGEAVAEGVDNQLEPIGNLELGEDRTEVVSYRSFTDEQSLADLLVLETFTDQCDDFAFSVSE